MQKFIQYSISFTLFKSFAAAFNYHDFKKRSMANPIDMYLSKRTVGDAMYEYMLNNSNVEKRAMVFEK